MAFNLFGPPTKDDIRVGYIDPVLGLVEGVTICQANDYALKNPGTTFVFRNGNNVLQYLNINEVNSLDPNILTSTDECGGINQRRECGPPEIQFFGGGGIGAAGNPVIGRDGSLLAVDLVRGGNGYQYAPLVAARDNCNYGTGATLTAIIGEVAETIETYENEADYEDYEICDPSDVGYGRLYGPNGEDIGPWEPRLYTDPGEDPIRQEIEDYEQLVRTLARKPFWSTRTSRPERIISSDAIVIPQRYDVTFPSWNEFMNKYAISPTPPSNIRGTDYSGVEFTFSWVEEFPIDGEYIFRGLVDNNAILANLYIDDDRIGDIPRYDDTIRPIRRTITKGLHTIRAELTNFPVTPASNIPGGYVEVDFSVYGQGGKNVSGYSFTFISVDGKDTFTLRGAQKSKETRIEKIKLRPNVDYKVLANHRDGRKLEQGLIRQGSKKREGGIGTSNKIFADGVKTANDNDDIQVTSLGGIFSASNFRKEGGRNTYDLTFRIDGSASSTSIVSSQSTEVVSSRSWAENPMGLALTIDAPAPSPPPQEQPPVQEGRCPNNPIWTTRFPGAIETWYPVRYEGEELEEIVSTSSEQEQVLETQEVEFSVFGEGGKNVSGYSFTFTAVDGQHTFTLNGVDKSKQTRVEKIQIRKGVNYVIASKHTDNRKVEQGLIREGTKRREGGIAESNKIFADGVKTANDNDDIQVTTNLGKFISANRTKVKGRSTFELTYVLEGSPNSTTTGNTNTPSKRIIRTSGWSKFLNRYAISPVPPLDTSASDNGGILFKNSWEVDIPYDGFYKFITEYDDDGRVLLDGNLAFTLQTAQRDVWRGLSDRIRSQKVFITRGRHVISVELENRKIETFSFSQINQKIFRTLDWHNGSANQNGVTYEGPPIFHYRDSRWSSYMNKNSLSPVIPGPQSSDNGRKRFTWRGVNFPESGQYDVTFLADTNARLIINGVDVLGSQGFADNPQTFKVNITQGNYDIVIDSEYPYDGLQTNNQQYFIENPTGFALDITKNVSVSQPGPGKSWKENPMGIGAILIPPPCPRRIRGGGVIADVIVNDPGNGYLRPIPQNQGYPVALRLKEIIVENPGINYNCGVDELRITPSNGAELDYVCDPFGKIREVKVLNPGLGFTEYPEIRMVSPPGVEPTGVNASFRPVFEVVRDPIVLPERSERLIQVTDLVGLKQTGYVDGRPYYGAVYYEDGVRFAGFYETIGEPVRVYDTLLESITAEVTTPPSAIQRQGTDVSSNDPRLNLPGSPENLI